MYLAVLVFVLVGSGWLEIGLRTRVYRRWRRLLLALAPGFVVFVGWDLYAVSQQQWRFDHDLIIGWLTPGQLPIEEVLFFVVIPIAAILTLEAVRSVQGWAVGDESSTSDHGLS